MELFTPFRSDREYLRDVVYERLSEPLIEG